MAWTAPKTFVANTTLTATDLNIYLRNNFLETAPAKATTSGSLFVGAGPNAIVERKSQLATITAAEGTSSTSYTNLETVGPAVTVTTGPRVLIIISAAISSSVVNTQNFMGYEISGTTSQAATDTLSLSTDGIAADKTNRRCTILMEETLNPGVNTFTCKYKVTAGTGTFQNRFIGVWPL